MARIALLIPHFNNPQGLACSLASVGAAEQMDAFIVDDGSSIQPLDQTLCQQAWQAQGQSSASRLLHSPNFVGMAGASLRCTGL